MHRNYIGEESTYLCQGLTFTQQIFVQWGLCIKHGAGFCHGSWFFPPTPVPYSRIQLSFFPVHCSISTQHLLLSAFSHELETWVNFHCHGHILIHQGVLAVLESWRESFFLYIFDVKIWDLILYIADLWPTTVGNNYQLATSLPSKPLRVQKGLSPEHNLGEGAQPAFLSSLPSCQHFKWETRPVSDQEDETGTFWNWEETYINQQPDHII